jgi:hypothetical protein
MAYVDSLDGLAEGDRIYVLRVSDTTPSGCDAVLVRSGIYSKAGVGVRQPGQHGQDQRSQAVLAYITIDGSPENRYSLDSLGIGENTRGLICVTSLEGITCHDGRDLRQRQAFDPKGTAQPDNPSA